MFIRIYRRGSSPTDVYAPRERVSQIVEEYRLLGWDVSW